MKITSISRYLAVGLAAASLGFALPAGASVKTHPIAFRAHYSGNIALLWSDSSVSATSLRATGPATILGARSTLSGSGKATTSATCDPLSGKGVLKGSGSTLTLMVKVSPATQACAAGDQAPTSVAVKGTATVLSGTGKFSHATGVLHFTGALSIKSNTAGSSEQDAFTATLTGRILVPTIPAKR